MVYTKICNQCGKEYRAKTRRSMFCSEECRRASDRERKRERYGATIEKRVCPECGRTYETKRKTSNFCSKACQRKFAERKKENRSSFDQASAEQMTLGKLFQREKGICYLCGGECDFSDVFIADGFIKPGRAFPSIDFVKATDEERVSQRLAHHYCLTQKEEKNDGV